eukprot:799792-Rhodomonas_salina.1
MRGNGFRVAYHHDLPVSYLSESKSACLGNVREKMLRLRGLHVGFRVQGSRSRVQSSRFTVQ